MTENLFVMVSEWMGGGNINRFLDVNNDANRLELVGFRSRSSHSLVADGRITIIARRHCQGVESFA